MLDNEIYEASKLLYVWLSKLGKKSIDSIRSSCDYLAGCHNLSGSNSIWNLFWPMVYSGVIDHAGKGYYALTEPLILNFRTHFYYINYRPQECQTQEVSIGIFSSNKLASKHDVKTMSVNPESILKKYPTIDNVIDGFSESLQDEKELKYYSSCTKKGVAELKDGGLKRFFSIPDKVYLRELPDRTINPDAFAIAYCYDRAINGKGNGTYYKDRKQLVTPSFAFPIMLYRALQLETMASRHLPQKRKEVYVFNGVSMPVVKELNRILCNSIRYE